MRVGKLTALAVQRAMRKRKPGLMNDGGGLYLKDGSSWIFRYARRGRRHDLGLGPAADVSLAEARGKAIEARRLLRDGSDPVQARRASRAVAAKRLTFAECAAQFHKAQSPGWRSAKHAATWRASIDAYAAPIIGDMTVDAIAVEHVLAVLGDLWAQKPDVAGRVRARVESVLDFATARGLRTGENPAAWRRLRHLLPALSKVHATAHFAALPYTEAPAFMSLLRGRQSIKARALEFTILTAVRSVEALGARWDEIDLDLWAIPAERMKSSREHRVPLSARALAIIGEMRSIRRNDFVFPGAKPGRPLGDMALFTMLRDMGRADVTAHGFRSTFRDWAGDHGFPREIAEAALAHVTGDQTEQAYRRSDALERRRALMAQWSNYCDGPAERGKVVSIAAR